MLNLTRKQSTILITTLLIGSGAAFFAIKEINQPDTFEECVLKNVKGEETGEAVAAIQYACMQLAFAADEPEQACRDLQQSEIGKLQLEFGSRKEYSGSIYLEANVYNGNKNIDLDKIYIAVSADNYKSQRDYEFISSGNKASALSSGVYQARSGSVPKGNVNWEVLSARACEYSKKD